MHTLLRSMAFRCGVLAVFGLVLGHVAIASQINFDPLAGTPDYTAIPAGYGSTVDVAVTYSTLKTFGGAISSGNIDFWNAGYGNLPTAGFQATNGLVGDITLTPLNGTTLTLNDFTMAGYYFTDKPLQTVEVLDASNAVLFAFNGTIPGCCLATGGSSMVFSPNLSSSGPLSIEWGTDWNAGINYVNFNNTVSSVPEPATLSLLAAGLCGLAAARRKRRAG
jgi:hypothetical protein